MDRSLFQKSGTDAVSGHPALLGGECTDCRYVYFPMQSYGCERCGSIGLRDRRLSGRGKLISRVRVHEHKAPGRTAPFTVGAVLLDEGVIVRALIDEAVSHIVAIGEPVVTMLVPDDREGMGGFDLRFTREID